MKCVFLVAILTICLETNISVANSQPERVQCVEPIRTTGCAEYKFLFFKLYRAILSTDATTLPGENFGLSLQYHRSFRRDELISTSLSEMMRISGRPSESFDTTRTELEQAMRSVAKGDTFTACRDRSGRVTLFHNRDEVGALTRDADLFLDIWLGPKTRKPAQRDKLLSGICHD